MTQKREGHSTTVEDAVEFLGDGQPVAGRKTLHHAIGPAEAWLAARVRSEKLASAAWLSFLSAGVVISIAGLVTAAITSVVGLLVVVIGAAGYVFEKTWPQRLIAANRNGQPMPTPFKDTYDRLQPYLQSLTADGVELFDDTGRLVTIERALAPLDACWVIDCEGAARLKSAWSMSGHRVPANVSRLSTPCPSSDGLPSSLPETKVANAAPAPAVKRQRSAYKDLYRWWVEKPTDQFQQRLQEFQRPLPAELAWIRLVVVESERYERRYPGRALSDIVNYIKEAAKTVSLPRKLPGDDTIKRVLLGHSDYVWVREFFCDSNYGHRYAAAEQSAFRFESGAIRQDSGNSG